MSRRRTREEEARIAEDLYTHRGELEEGEVVDLLNQEEPALVSSVISVRVSSKDLATLEVAAKHDGMKVSTYLRVSALQRAAGMGEEFPEDPRLEELRDAVREMALLLGVFDRGITLDR